MSVVKAFIDLSFKSLLNEEADLRLAAEMGYVVIASEGVGRYFRTEALMIVPRKTYLDPTMPVSKEVNEIRVYRVEAPDKLKITNKVKARAHAIEIGGRALGKLGIKNLRKLVNTNIPIIVNINEIYSRLKGRKPLGGLADLLNLYEQGKITLVLGSGATSVHDLRHPYVMTSLMIELGLSEAKAIALMTSNPEYIIRRAGYVVNR